MRYFFLRFFIMQKKAAFGFLFQICLNVLPKVTQWNKLMRLAWDALGLCLYDRINSSEAIPQPSDVSKIRTKKNSFVVIIEFDMDMYLKKHNTRAVKKTLSIPQWLNEKAVSKGINFSQVLQEALLDRLGA